MHSLKGVFVYPGKYLCFKFTRLPILTRNIVITNYQKLILFLLLEIVCLRIEGKNEAGIDLK